MAIEIDLTNGPVRVTAAAMQPLSSAVDVSKVDQLDLICLVLGNPGAGSGPTINILTAMSADSEFGWDVAASFSAATLAAAGQERINVKGLLKFARWNVAATGGANPLTISIRGMGRQN